jgi:hypothetical protein
LQLRSKNSDHHVYEHEFLNIIARYRGKWVGAKKNNLLMWFGTGLEQALEIMLIELFNATT